MQKQYRTEERKPSVGGDLWWRHKVGGGGTDETDAEAVEKISRVTIVTTFEQMPRKVERMASCGAQRIKLLNKLHVRSNLDVACPAMTSSSG